MAKKNDEIKVLSRDAEIFMNEGEHGTYICIKESEDDKDALFLSGINMYRFLDALWTAYCEECEIVDVHIEQVMEHSKKSGRDYKKITAKF